MADKWTCPQCNNVALTAKKVGTKQTYNVAKGVMGEVLVGTAGALAGFEDSDVLECVVCGCKFINQGNHSKIVEYGNKWKENIKKVGPYTKFSGKGGKDYRIGEDPRTLSYRISTYENGKYVSYIEINQIFELEYDTEETLSMTLFGRRKNGGYTITLATYFFEDADELLAMVEKIQSACTFLGECHLKVKKITKTESQKSKSNSFAVSMKFSAILAIIPAIISMGVTGVFHIGMFFLMYLVWFIVFAVLSQQNPT